MIPDASKHNPDPAYLRELVTRSGKSQRECARAIGISDRAMREYLRLPKPDKPAPYLVQFALECLAAQANYMLYDEPEIPVRRKP